MKHHPTCTDPRFATEIELSDSESVLQCNSCGAFRRTRTLATAKTSDRRHRYGPLPLPHIYKHRGVWQMARTFNQGVGVQRNWAAYSRVQWLNGEEHAHS